VKIKLQGLALAVTCRCGREMSMAYAAVNNVVSSNFVCLARKRWNFFLHDEPISYADARKRVS